MGLTTSLRKSGLKMFHTLNWLHLDVVYKILSIFSPKPLNHQKLGGGNSLSLTHCLTYLTPLIHPLSVPWYQYHNIAWMHKSLGCKFLFLHFPIVALIYLDIEYFSGLHKTLHLGLIKYLKSSCPRSGSKSLNPLWGWAINSFGNSGNYFCFWIKFLIFQRPTSSIWSNLHRTDWLYACFFQLWATLNLIVVPVKQTANN